MRRKIRTRGGRLGYNSVVLDFSFLSSSPLRLGVKFSLSKATMRGSSERPFDGVKGDSLRIGEILTNGEWGMAQIPSPESFSANLRVLRV